MKYFLKNGKCCKRFRRMRNRAKIARGIRKGVKVTIAVLNLAILAYHLYENYAKKTE